MPRTQKSRITFIILMLWLLPCRAYASPNINGYHSNDPTLQLALPKQKQDWVGLTRDTGVFLGAQFIVIGALYALPNDVSGWSREDKEAPIQKRWFEHTRQIVWEHDAWYINYMLHPYWGGTYYIRAHERGFGESGSFWYAVLLSSLFEYTSEALFEPVSLQDIFVTPIVGIVAGRWFEEIRAPIKLKSTLDFNDRLVLWITDPLGIASRWVERRLKMDAAVGIGQLNRSTRLAPVATRTPTLQISIRF